MQTLLAEEREEKERVIDNLENAIKVERRAVQSIEQELEVCKNANLQLNSELTISLERERSQAAAEFELKVAADAAEEHKLSL